MAKASSRPSATTTLSFGSVDVPVVLFSAHGKPAGTVEFDTAGPNGGRLVTQQVVRPVPAEEPEKPAEQGDPLGTDEDKGDDFAKAWERVCVSDEPLGIPTDGELDRAQAVAQPAPELEPVEATYVRALVEEGTGVVVAPDRVRRGVRQADGTFVDCTEQLAEIERATKLERMAIVRFRDLAHVPRARVKAAHYIAPTQTGPPPRALTLLYQGLRKTRKVAEVKLTKRTRQTLGVIGTFDGALMLYELVWAEDFREAPGRAKAIHAAEVAPEQVERMVELIEAMSERVCPEDELRDDALALREALYARAMAGADPKMEAGIDDALAEQLEASLLAVGRL